MRADIAPGGAFADSELPDHTGTPRRLSALQGPDPMILTLARNGYWFWGRPSFDDLWRELRAATREVRPDWDLSAPGLREARDADDWSRIHGCDRHAGSRPKPS